MNDRINFRAPPATIDKIKWLAKLRGVTVTAVIISCLRSYLDREISKEARINKIVGNDRDYLDSPVMEADFEE